MSRPTLQSVSAHCLLTLALASPLGAQHTPAISAGVVAVTNHDDHGPAFGGTMRVEVPVLEVSSRISLVVGVGGWVARSSEAQADGVGPHFDHGGGPLIGFTSSRHPGVGLTATITTGIEWLQSPRIACGFVPPGGCSPPPERSSTAFTIAGRVHQPIGSRTALEGGVVMARHELRVEPRWGHRFELGLRFGLGK